MQQACSNALPTAVYLIFRIWLGAGARSKPLRRAQQTHLNARQFRNQEQSATQSAQMGSGHQQPWAPMGVLPAAACSNTKKLLPCGIVMLVGASCNCSRHRQTPSRPSMAIAIKLMPQALRTADRFLTECASVFPVAKARDGAQARLAFQHCPGHPLGGEVHGDIPVHRKQQQATCMRGWLLW